MYKFLNINIVYMIFNKEALESYTNVLLIDKDLIDYEIIVNSVNAFTLPVVYSSSSSRTEISTLLENLHFSRIGFCFNSSLAKSKMFLDQELFDDSYQNDNVLFVLDLIKKFSITNIDFLACDTLKYANWQKYFAILTDAGVIVGASNDKTGNVEYGGNWIMESTGENIESVYFTENIRKYPHLLDFWATSAQGLVGSGVFIIWNIASDGTYIYALNYDSNLVRININDPTIFSTTWISNKTSTNFQYGKMVCDNTYLYSINYGKYFIRINLITGLYERVYQSIIVTITSCCMDDVYLYYITSDTGNALDYSQKLKKIKKSDGTVTIICNLPDSNDPSILDTINDMEVYDGFVYLLDNFTIHRINITTNEINYNWVTIG